MDFDQEALAAAQGFANQNAGDEKLFVTFYIEPVQNVGKSDEEGRPIFEDTECIRIMVPGDKNNVIIRPASKQDKARFRKQYDIFKSGDGEAIVGTPLAAWPLVTRSQVEEFRYFGIRSVENLAELRDDVMLRMPGAAKLKQQAVIYLEFAKDNAGVSRVSKEMDVLRNENVSLKAALDDLAQQMKEMKSKKATANA